MNKDMLLYAAAALGFNTGTGQPRRVAVSFGLAGSKEARMEHVKRRQRKNKRQARQKARNARAQWERSSGPNKLRTLPIDEAVRRGL